MATKRPADEAGLTERQREVVELLALGYSNAEIAKSLGISLDGAKWHVSEILARLDVWSREEAADWWLNHRQRRLPLPLRALAIALALPLRVAAALGEIIRPGPSVRIRVDEGYRDMDRAAITEPLDPATAPASDVSMSTERVGAEHIRDPSLSHFLPEAAVADRNEDSFATEGRPRTT
jgi:DNA-binding CsgD family transcriptional regulator